MVQDRVAAAADDQLSAEFGTAETGGRADLSERDQHVQLANNVAQLVKRSDLASRPVQQILDDPVTKEIQRMCQLLKSLNIHTRW